MTLSKVKYLENRIKRAEGCHAQHVHRLLGRKITLTPERVRMMEPGSIRALRSLYADACRDWTAWHVNSQMTIGTGGRRFWRLRSNRVQNGEQWLSDQYHSPVEN